MKIQSRRKKVPANKIFTDREKPREAFWKSYSQYKETMRGEGEVKVLAYYGIGGIGKSTLLQKLQEEIRENIPDPRYVYFDFNIAQDARTVLEYLKTKISKDYGFSFPLYELGVYAYAQKIGENMASPQIQGFIERSPFLKIAVTITGLLPFAGMALNILNATDKSIAYLRTVISNHKREIRDIESKTPEELYEYLPYLFAQDMANMLENSTEPMVIFLDTYERLVNEMSPVGEPLNNDLWLRGEYGLIQNIPNVLWVIAGREKLKWELFNVEWKEALEQHLLGNLSRTDADSFMRSAGILNEALRKGLYDLTQGTPVYLDLCVDSCNSLLEQGKEPELSDFGKNVYSLIERFARYMDDSRKDIVYMLSCIKIWNDIMISELGSEVIPWFSLTTYEKVKQFSFVTRSDKYDYNIHQTVGEALFANCPQVIKESTVQHAVPYCEKRLCESGTFDSSYIYHLQWLVGFGLQNYENDDEFIIFYNGHLKHYLKKLSVSGQASLAEHIFEPVMTRANKSGKSLLKALALSESSFWKHNKGEYAESVALSEESVSLYEELLGDNNEVTLKARHRLGEQLRSNGEYRRSYDVLNDVLSIRRSLSMPPDEEEVDIRDDIASTMLLLGNYREALPFIEETLKLREQLPKEEKPSWYNTLWNLGDVYHYLGRYRDSLSVRETLYKKSRELLGESHPGSVKAIVRLADTFSFLGRFKDALPLREQALELRKGILGEKHPETISAMHELAISLSNLGRYKEALPIREQVLELRKEILGEKHPETIRAMNDLSMSLSDLGRYKEALSIREQVLALNKETLGEKHPNTIIAVRGLANSFLELGRYKKELRLREQVLALNKETLGEKHPITMISMNEMAISLSNSGRYEEALSLQEQVLALNKDILGEKHPGTISAMYDMACTLSDLGRYEEALPLREEVLKLRKEVLGEKHPDTVLAINGLARHYFLCGKFEEGLPYAEKAVKLSDGNDDVNERSRNGVLDTLALLYSETGSVDKALEITENNMQTAAASYSSDRNYLASRHYAAAYCLNKAQRFKEAFPHAEQAFKIRKELKGDHDRGTIRAKELLEEIKHHL